MEATCLDFKSAEVITARTDSIQYTFSAGFLQQYLSLTSRFHLSKITEDDSARIICNGFHLHIPLGCVNAWKIKWKIKDTP